MSEPRYDEISEVASPVEKQTWADLALYLFSGFGLFVLASMFVGSFFTELTFGLTLLSILMNLIFVGGSAYFWGIRRNKISWKQLGIKPPIWKWEYLLYAFVLAVGLMPIRGVIGLISQLILEGDLESLVQRENLILAGGLSWSGFLLTFVGVGILAPISEELYFRGLLHHWFRERWSVNASIVASSLLFGLAHFDSVGVLVSSFIMGLVMAYVYEKTQTLWITIAIHIITNSIAVLLIYISMVLVKYFDLPGF